MIMKAKKVGAYSVLLVLVFILSGCDALIDECYSEGPLLDVNDDNPASEYSEYYEELISEEATNLGIDFEYEVILGERYFSIDYINSDFLISFVFNNSSGYYSYVYYFNENIDDLFQYDKLSIYIQFVANVNELVVHMHQGDIDTYRDMYVDYLDKKADRDYIYFSNSCNSRLGYSISVWDNYSETENRWFISLKYHGLLEPVNLEDN